MSREFWVVPVSQLPVQVSTIQSTVLPTSVAMQTVSKNYVDTAIAAAVTGHPLDSSTHLSKRRGYDDWAAGTSRRPNSHDPGGG